MITTRFFILFLTTGLFSCTKSISTTMATPVITDTVPMANTIAKTDTLTVMAYNVLYYGNGCQSSTAALDGYLKTILQFSKPDLLSCEKMMAFNSVPGATGNLADEIVNNVLNISSPNQYAYAIPTNNSGGKGMSVLFYNKQKLSYVKTIPLLAYITDFDLYKLYYNDINLPIVKDTTFLYVVVNHTQSGSSSATRDQQVSQYMAAMRSKFLYFPNLINMGDFNTANSFEAGYQSIVKGIDSSTLMNDPPYYPDRILQYPGNWDSTPYTAAPYLTTSTRASADIPNSCGTSGGGKGWFDHIFISPWLTNGKNFIQYLPNSYHAIGNDGNRVGVDINSTSPVINGSAPAAVIDALFQFSNKYPVTLKLIIKANRNGQSPADPIERN